MELSKFVNTCYLCFQHKHDQNMLLCFQCISKFDEYKNYLCPRCTKIDCTGCVYLNEFRFIFCIYTYHSVISKIIATAKDKFNMNFQKMFTEIFYASIQRELEQILAQRNYHIIILSPYRKERLFHGYWHPNILFFEILTNIRIKYSYNFQVVQTHYTTFKKQKVFWQMNISKKLHSGDQTNILLCDDVLTTGTSALQCKRAVSKQLINSTWDLFTIFRSPQKYESRGQAAD